MLLKGITVIELAGLAPAPFCGMILSDFGARVIRIDRPRAPSLDNLGRGKQSLVLDLKQEAGVSILKRLCKKSDVLLEPYRPGVMEKLGLGPDLLIKENPRLIYARLTGYGQTGDMALKAGHDINYIATSGLLSRLGPKGGRPTPPINLLADFAGGGLICALGTVMALYERSVSGKGQVIDANMVQGSAYLGTFLDSAKSMFPNERGTNLIDGGSAFYDTYKTKDGKYMAVGSLEPKFYSDLLKGLALDPKEVSQGDDQEEQRQLFQRIFSTKTQAEWTQVFSNLDACVTPILSPEEAANLPHNKIKDTFIKVLQQPGNEPTFQAGPAPNLSRTPADLNMLRSNPVIGEHTTQVLEEFGFSHQEMKDLLTKGVVHQVNKSNL